MYNGAAMSHINSQYLRAISFTLCLYVQPLLANTSVTNVEQATQPAVKAAVVETKSLQLYAEQWELARTGESVLALPELNKLINTWLGDKNKIIEIRYPGGEEGEFWVQSLSDWLVSLGIPSDRMVTVPGSGSDDMIKFALIK
ncbi:hypothetical protein MNBD_GAMMA05-2327 [hydrothermal vent metagenome]|uniref:Uncharacterized protein n=1 Tax=hydrothermal vent metagenome TaxID=652676 RepID=A0A3B0WV98_9ZZZZ